MSDRTSPRRRLTGRCICLLFAVIATCAASGEPLDLPEPTPLQKLENRQECDRCSGTLLPGRLLPHPETRWGIISDLPESFKGYGVLYSTRPVLPENGAPEEMLQQRLAPGFQGIDGSFDVFLFHLNKSPSGAQRLVVYVRNTGSEPVTVRPEQVIKSEGIIGTVHEFESTLGARVLKRDWDRPLESVTIPAGEGRVVAFGKQFGNGAVDGPDSSRNVNCFGYARVHVENSATTPSLEVSVIAIPGGDRGKMDEEARRYADVGASSTDEVSLKGEPKNCALGRAVGVYPNFVWVSDDVVIDATSLPEEGTTFPMALPAAQTPGCPEARQTQELVCHPGYTRPETIGNYMIETGVNFTLTNPGERSESVDLVFGKDGADVGLAYAVQIGEKPGAEPAVHAEGVRTLWAGPKQSAREKPLLEKPVVIPPGEARTVFLRYLVLGNSSLPFHLGLKPARPEN